MKNKYLAQFLAGLSVFPLLIYIAFIVLYNHKSHGYIVGDWLINFQGGFTRRGLGGYLIDVLSTITSIKLNYLTALIQIFLLLGFILEFDTILS